MTGQQYIKVKFKLVSNEGFYSRHNYFSGNPLRNYVHILGLRSVWDLVKSKRYNRILEIGCADGIFLPSLAQLGDELYASDIDDSFLLKTKESHALPNLNLFNDNICNSNFDDSFFDLVVCLETLEHLQDPKKAITNIKRIMKPNARGIISIPVEIGPPVLFKQISRLLAFGMNKSYLLTGKELYRAFTMVFKKATPHSHSAGHTYFDYRNIIHLIRESGLKVDKIKYIPLNLIQNVISYRVIIDFRKAPECVA